MIQFRELLIHLHCGLLLSSLFRIRRCFTSEEGWVTLLWNTIMPKPMVLSTVTVQGVMWGEATVKQITYFSTEEVFMPLGNGIMCHKLYIAAAVCQCRPTEASWLHAIYKTHKPLVVWASGIHNCFLTWWQTLKGCLLHAWCLIPVPRGRRETGDKGERGFIG